MSDAAQKLHWSDEPGAAAPVPFTELRWKSADGLSLYARDYAPAVKANHLPLICLHGLTRNSKDFEDFAPWAAAMGYRVIAPDIRGRGQSDRAHNPKSYSPAVYARDIAGLMKQIGIRSGIFVGTSMGGLIMMAMALRHKHLFAGAVINDIAPEIAPEGLARIMQYAGSRPSFANWDEAVGYAQKIGGVVYPDYTIDDWRRVAARIFCDEGEGVALDYDPKIIEAAIGARIKPPTWFAWFLFRRLTAKIPALLIRGELSDLLSEEIAARVKAKCQSIEVVTIPNVGHAPELSEPAAKAAIKQFLAQIPPL